MIQLKFSFLCFCSLTCSLKDISNCSANSTFHLHFAGFFTYMHLHGELVEFLLRCKSNCRGKLTISLDPNFDESKEWNLSAVLPLLDIFVPNETEAMSITRTSTVSDAAEKLLKSMKPDSNLIITLGKDGMLYSKNGRMLQMAALPQVPAIDATGACLKLLKNNFDGNHLKYRI